MFHRHDSGGAGRLPGWLSALASPRWTVLFFVLTAAAALAAAYQLTTPTLLMTAPFALLLTNVGAAIFVNGRFRADLPLLLFHLALLVLVALLVLARLIYMEGKTTLTSGTTFEGQLVSEARGPLHRGRLADVRFSNEGFTEDYTGRHKLHATYNRVRWQDDTGQWHEAKIGDDHPLLIKGYKIFTSQHRGFSPVFLWQTADGNISYGTVQLGDQLDGAFLPNTKFTLPGGGDAWAMMDFNPPPQPTGKSRVGLGSGELEHSLVLRIGHARHVLRPGDPIALPGGRLTYVRLDSWMGYTISYDPTRPWIFATVLIGIGSLIWFYWRRLFGRGATARAPL